MNTRIAMRFRRRLLEELGQRGRLLDGLRRSVAERGRLYMEDGGAFSSHMADMATEEADRESAVLLADVQGRTVQEIEEALRRIDEGRFGTCQRCDRAIEPKRLEVLPYARYCLRCQEKEDRIRKN